MKTIVFLLLLFTSSFAFAQQAPPTFAGQRIPGFIGVEKPVGSGRYVWNRVKNLSVVDATTIDIEAGFFTLSGTNPKLGFLDQTSGSYRDLYGPLVHPIRVDDREFLPNVIVFQVDSGATDTIHYVAYDTDVYVHAAAHGLTGKIYIGDDGELTSFPPADSFRQVEVGKVIDANTLFIGAPNTRQLAAPITKSFRAEVFSRFEYLPTEPGTAISDLTVNNGTAEIWRDDVLNNGSPTAANILQAITDISDADEIRFDGPNTGFTVEFSAASYVSDVWLTLSRQTLWKTTGAARAKLEVLAYDELVDVVPAKTVVVWDTGVEPIPESGLHYEATLDRVAAKIEVRWSVSTGVQSLQGGLQHMEIFGKGRMDTIAISPGDSRITHDRWDIVPEDKAILCSNRWSPGQHEAQIGVEINTNEVFMNYFFDWGRAWDTSSSTLATTVDTNTFGRRGYFDWVHNATANDKFQSKLHWLSLDVEFDATHNTGWTYHPDDDAAAALAKTNRWRSAMDSFRNITPNKLLGPYTHPQYSNIVGIQGHISLSGGAPTGSYYRRALEREAIAKPLYDMCDYMCPPIYDVTGYSLRDWRALCEFYRDACHRNGKLCIPHISARNFGADTLVADFADRLQIASEAFDGWIIFESRTDAPHSEPEKLIVAEAYRSEIERLQRDPVGGSAHLDIPAGDLSPSVSGYSSARSNGSGDIIVNFDDGDVDQVLIFELAAGDTLDAGTGTIDFGPGGPSDPWSPVSGGTMILRYDGVEWKRLIHQ